MTAAVGVAGYTAYNFNRVVDNVGSGIASLPAKARNALGDAHLPDISNLANDAQEELKHLEAAAKKAATPLHLATNLKWIAPVTVGVVLIGLALALYSNLNSPGFWNRTF